MNTEETLRVILDNREQKLEETIKENHPNITYEMKQLDVGDIIVSEDVAIERKEGGDFVGSIVDNRLFEQFRRLKETYSKCILILEGLNDSVFERTGMNIKSIYGALAYVSYKMEISVIPTRNVEDTAIVVERIAYREQVKDEKPVLSRSAPKNMDTFERRCFVLEGLLNVGSTKAEQLIEKFETPFKVFEAIKYTKVLYTSTGNPKGIQGPLDSLSGFGVKFLKRNKELVIGKEDGEEESDENFSIEDYL